MEKYFNAVLLTLVACLSTMAKVQGFDSPGDSPTVCYDSTCKDPFPYACGEECGYINEEIGPNNDCSCAPFCAEIVTDEPCDVCDSDYCKSSEIGEVSCFAGSSRVELYGKGVMALRDVERPSEEEVLSADQDGNLQFANLYHFMHAEPNKNEIFYKITTGMGSLDVTGKHLLLDGDAAVFAEDVVIGSKVQMVSDGKVVPMKVNDVSKQYQYGAFAPLTSTGSVIVDGVLASCYATINDHKAAHWAMSPVRILGSAFGHSFIGGSGTMHWYSRMMYGVAIQAAGKL